MTQTVSRFEQIDPRTLLVDVNVRTDLQLDKQFVATIKDHGVLVPIVGVESPDGIRVRFGHRRTLAAVEAGLDTVPVLVVDPQSGEPDSEAAEIDRIVTQHVENTHRAGLTAVDEVEVAKQLAGFGLSPAQIARKTRTKKARVEQAVKVAGSELAEKATARYELTLEQAATLAEFDDDPETVKALVAAAKEGRFEHVAQRARDKRAEQAAHAQAAAELAEQGIPLVPIPGYLDPKVRDIARLRDQEGNELTAQTHAECPGRAAYIHVYRDFDTGEIVAEINQVCTDYRAHGHIDPADELYGSGKPKKKPVEEMSDEEREQARAARRLIIDYNKAWASAAEVRRDWLRTFVARKTPPKGAAKFVAAMIAQHPNLLDKLAANHLAADLLGQPQPEHAYDRSSDIPQLITDADDRRAQVIALTLALAACEAAIDKDTWRRDGLNDEYACHGDYLRFLAAHGYALSEVEAYAASDQTV